MRAYICPFITDFRNHCSNNIKIIKCKHEVLSQEDRSDLGFSCGLLFVCANKEKADAELHDKSESMLKVGKENCVGIVISVGKCSLNPLLGGCPKLLHGEN